MEKIKDSRIGETKIMNNGQKATIIACRNFCNIDVQFEDGTIVRHKYKSSWNKGNIKNPNLSKMKIKYIGTTKMMNCGMNATIIAYRCARDIDVQFEDGTIVKHINKANFNKGYVKNPNLNVNKNVGITKMMNCGMNATIIVYKNNRDIDVQFEDGTIVQHKCKNSFDRGSIANPNLKANKSVETTKMMNCGMNATIIAYRNKKDIDIQFEDGTIVQHKTKNAFYKRRISNPNLKANKSVGKTNIMNNGQKAIIIAYRNSKDIDVQFEDGTIVQHRNKEAFVKGKISNPNYVIYASKYVGETRMMHNGMNATIIAYKNNRDIDVQFEDGTIVQHKCKNAFDSGLVANPNLETKKRKSNAVGKTRMMNCGMNATIIAYRNSKDIDVQFEDGTIVEHKYKNNFDRGWVNNPNLNANKSVGKTRMMHNGMNATIIAYKNNKDIDIQFEDGTVVQHRDIGAFRKGYIKNPNLKSKKE